MMIAVTWPALAQDLTPGVVDLGSWSAYSRELTSPVVKVLVEHRGRIYIGGEGSSNGQSNSATYYDIHAEAYGADREANGTTIIEIDNELITDGMVAQGDLLMIGEDGASAHNTAWLYVRRHDGWRHYQPDHSPNAHRQAQHIYEGKIFMANYYASKPGVAISYDGGMTTVEKNQQSSSPGSPFPTVAENGVGIAGWLTHSFFEFRGSLFALNWTQPVPNPNNPLQPFPPQESWMTRYTGHVHQPWERVYRRIGDLGLPGVTPASNSVFWITKPREFKGYLFLANGTNLYRYGSEPITGEFGSYERPAGGTLVSSQQVAYTLKHGYFYCLKRDADRLTLTRTPDGVGWQTIGTLDVGTGSRLTYLQNRAPQLAIAGEDVYLGAGERMYRIPGGLLGSLRPDGAANTPPVASDDTYATVAGFVSRKDAFLGPLMNDRDADSDAFYATLVSGPTNGSLVFRYNGTFDYAAEAPWPGADSFIYQISDGYGVSTATVRISGDPLPDNSDFSSVKINFQAPAGVPPVGYISDSGATRGFRNGFYYGWDASQTGTNRAAHADFLLDSFVSLGASARWQISVPNGIYEIKACLGDATGATTHMSLDVEGVPCFVNAYADPGQFLVTTETVVVNDGWLTVDNGTSPAGAVKWNYLEITRRSESVPPPSFLSATSTGSSQIQLIWNDASATELGFAIERKTEPFHAWTPVSTVPANAESYCDAGLSPMTRYTYRVRALGGQGHSAWSAQSSAATQGTPLPASDQVFHPSLNWRFDETEGSTAFDSSVHALNMSLTGSPAWTHGGQVGGALELNGATQYGRVPDRDVLDNSESLTLSLWVRPDGLTENPQFLVSKRASPTSQNAYALFFHTGGKLYVDIAGNDNRFSSNTVFTDGRWRHVSVVFDGTLASPERVKIYVDGVLDKTAPETSSAIPNTTADLYVGQGDATSTARFRGGIDDLRLYRAALSNNQVATLANRTPPLATTHFPANYAAWAAGAFPAGIPDSDRLPEADPNRDSMVNLIAYAFGLDPWKESARAWPQAMLVTSNGSLALQYRFRRNKHAHDLTFTPLVSADLVEWAVATYEPVVIDPDVEGNGIAELVEISIPFADNASQIFVRLKIDLNPSR